MKLSKAEGSNIDKSKMQLVYFRIEFFKYFYHSWDTRVYINYICISKYKLVVYDKGSKRRLE